VTLGFDTQGHYIGLGSRAPSNTNAHPNNAHPNSRPTQAVVVGTSAPSAIGSVTLCSYNVNGQTFSGNTQADCDKIKHDLGLDQQAVPRTPTTPPTQAQVPTPAPTLAQVPTPAPTLAQVPTGAPTQVGASQPLCSFNVNGVTFTGTSQAECDELRREIAANQGSRKADPSTTQSSSTSSSTSLPAWGWVLLGIGAAIGAALLIVAAIMLQRSNAAHRSETV
jgi:hypothetical protein